MDYTLTKLYYGIIFWPIGVDARDKDVTMVLALGRISSLFGLFF